MYVKVTNGAVEKYPYTIHDLRVENPSTSFPSVISDEILSSFGVYKVTIQSTPTVDRTQYAVKQDLPELVDGQWVLSWSIFDKSPEALAEESDRKIDDIRDSRNGKLTACDWTQLPDAGVDKDAWATYRQALRDVPQQPGFPWDVVWPVPPS